MITRNSMLISVVLLFLLHVSEQTVTKEYHERKTTVIEEVTVEEDEFDNSDSSNAVDDDDADKTSSRVVETSSSWEYQFKELKATFVTFEQKAIQMMNAIQNQQKRIETMSAQISTLSRQVSYLESKNTSSFSKNSVTSSTVSSSAVVAGKGVSYVRWGRTKCSDNATVLYYGYAATGRWNETGGGSNFLCMPVTPQGAVKSTARGTRLFGIEYDFHSTPFSAINNRNQSFYYNDMPCAVCHTEYRNDQLMIPAKNTCPIGWTREYTGYLVSSWYKNARSNFYCLDGAPEVVPGGSARADTAYAHPVDVQCGPLPCSAYSSGDRVACVVCSK